METNERTRPHRTVDQQELFGLHLADSRGLREHLADFVPAEESKNGFFDVTITSPPYADQKDYGYDETLQIGFGDSYEQYLDALRVVFRQTYDLTKPSGTLWIVANTLKRNGRLVQLPFDIADICENLRGVNQCLECDTSLITVRESGIRACPSCGWTYDGVEDSWRLQDVVIWDKVRALPWSSKGSFRNVFEYILCFSKTNDFAFDLDDIRIADPDELKGWWVDYPERYHPRGKLPDNIWQMVTPNQGAYGDGTLDHPAPFPPGLVERIVRLTTDEEDVVFDPFAGTGTVLAQAEAMGRNALGFELNREYVDAFPRLREKVIQDHHNQTGRTISQQQEDFTELLCGLREIRYARELIRTTRDSLSNPSIDELGVNTILVLSEGPDKCQRTCEGNYTTAAYFVVLDDDVNDSKFQELRGAVEERSQAKPCSAFGIDAAHYTLRLSYVPDFINGYEEWLTVELFLYSGTIPSRYNTTLSLRKWRRYVASGPQWRSEHVRNNHPPILSNVGLTVDDPSGEGPGNELRRSVVRRYPEKEVSVDV